VKRWEFETRLKRSPPLKAAILWDNPSLIDLCAESYLKSLPNDLSVVKLYYDEFNLGAAQSHIASQGLFNGGNLLIVRIDKKLETKTLLALLETIRKNASSYMLFIYDGEDAKETKAKLSQLEKNENAQAFYAVVRLYAPKVSEAAKYLAEAAAKRGLELNEAQAHHLLRISENNLSFAIAELGKLAIYNETGSSLIDLVSAGYGEGDYFRLIAAIVDKKPFYAELEPLFLQSETEMGVLRELSRAFRQLFSYFFAMRLGKASVDFLGFVMPPEIDAARKNLASRFKRSQWAGLFEALSVLELNFKRSETREKKSLLYALLIRFQTNLL
jgi:DNA polymerase III delta subunit